MIAGIAFLAVELHQNNRLLDAQVSHDLLRNRIDMRFDIYRDPEVARLDLKAANGETLDELEQHRVKNYSEATIIGFEWEYLQYVAGNVGYLPLDQWKRRMTQPRFRADVWEPNKWLLSEEFIAFVETEIFTD